MTLIISFSDSDLQNGNFDEDSKFIVCEGRIPSFKTDTIKIGGIDQQSTTFYLDGDLSFHIQDSTSKRTILTAFKKQANKVERIKSARIYEISNPTANNKTSIVKQTQLQLFEFNLKVDIPADSNYVNIELENAQGVIYTSYYTVPGGTNATEFERYGNFVNNQTLKAALKDWDLKAAPELK